MMFLFPRSHVSADGAHAGAVNLLEGDFIAMNVEQREPFDERARVSAGAHERAKRHIAARAGKAIKVESSHQKLEDRKTRIRMRMRQRP